MTDVKRELIWLLCSDDLSDSQFRAAALWLRNGGLEECIEGALLVRRALFSPILETASAASAPPGSVPGAESPKARGGKVSANGDLVADVRRLLIEESGLPAGAAIARLVERLGMAHALPKKKGFGELVLRIAREAGGSRVLTAAHQIRNERAHSGSSDAWSLRGSDAQG